MTRYLAAAALVLTLTVATSAQPPAVPVLTTPTNTSSLAWDYTPGPTETPISTLHHFDVQWTPTGLWTGANKLLTVPVPTLTPGAYVARVRACTLVTTTTGCTVSAPLAFTVVAPPSGALAATPSGMRLGLTVPAPPPPPPPPPPTGALLFSSGWETATLGCGAQLLDGLWADYGGSTACDGAIHDADVVSDVHHDGAHSLRVTQKPGGINGTDFRIVSPSFGAQPELTMSLWVFYAANYHWANADHKIVLLMGGANQNVYINYRGGSDPQHARLCMAPTANDTVFCQTNGPQITVNTWTRIRVHVVTGTHGTVELFITPQGQAETALILARDAGTGATVPTDVNTGIIDAIKYDTTYNDGASVTVPMLQYVDDIAVYRGLAP